MGILEVELLWGRAEIYWAEIYIVRKSFKDVQAKESQAPKKRIA